jgi:hypothetical protein
MATAASSVPERYLNPLNSIHCESQGILPWECNSGNQLASASFRVWWSGLWYAPWFGRGFLQLTNPEITVTIGLGAPQRAFSTALISAYSGIAGTQPASAAYKHESSGLAISIVDTRNYRMAFGRRWGNISQHWTGRVVGTGG